MSTSTRTPAPDTTNDSIQLMSSDGELVPCSRSKLCQQSPIFAHLFEDTNQTLFRVPLSTAVLQEIRFVCSFGYSSFNVTEITDEPKMRLLCELLETMETYRVNQTLCSLVYYVIIKNVLRRSQSLACVVMDEFGLNHAEEWRHWINRSIKDALEVLKANPYSVLFLTKNGIGGVWSIHDAVKVKKILSELKTCTNATVWLEFEALFIWAHVNDANRVAAAELWQEMDMLARLETDDPQYFASSRRDTFNADGFGSGDAFVSLHKYASSKNKAAFLALMNNVAESNAAAARYKEEEAMKVRVKTGLLVEIMFVGIINTMYWSRGILFRPSLEVLVQWFFVSLIASCLHLAFNAMVRFYLKQIFRDHAWSKYL